jgi:hypothetical protein
MASACWSPRSGDTSSDRIQNLGPEMNAILDALSKPDQAQDESGAGASGSRRKIQQGDNNHDLGM